MHLSIQSRERCKIIIVGLKQVIFTPAYCIKKVKARIPPQMKQQRGLGLKNFYPTMPSSHVPAFFIFLTLFFFCIDAQTTLCNNETFSFAINGKNIAHCRKLGVLGAEFGWNYESKTQNTRSSNTVEILFGAKLPDRHGWVAWGVNPINPQMVGTRAFIAIRERNGSTVLAHYNVTEDTKHGCRLQPSPIELNYVQRGGVEYSPQTGFLTMFLTVTLPSNYNVSSLNHVWQVGSHVEDMEPKMHATTVQNFNSYEVINLANGVSSGHYLRRLREVSS